MIGKGDGNLAQESNSIHLEAGRCRNYTGEWQDQKWRAEPTGQARWWSTELGASGREVDGFYTHIIPQWPQKSSSETHRSCSHFKDEETDPEK